MMTHELKRDFVGLRSKGFSALKVVSDSKGVFGI